MHKCLLSLSDGQCTHPFCNQFYSINSQSGGFVNENQIIESLICVLLSRTSVLRDLHSSSKQISEKTEEIMKQRNDVEAENSSKIKLLNLDKEYPQRIVTLGDLPVNVLKEKGFQLAVTVHDSSNSIAHCSELFKVKLYTNESPPKLLKVNIASKKILRGTLEVYMNEQGVVNFENIVINEVSSHYSKESFILVVSCEEAQVRPMVIENLYVRARNSNKRNREDELGED